MPQAALGGTPKKQRSILYKTPVDNEDVALRASYIAQWRKYRSRRDVGIILAVVGSAMSIAGTACMLASLKDAVDPNFTDSFHDPLWLTGFGLLLGSPALIIPGAFIWENNMTQAEHYRYLVKREEPVEKPKY